MEGSGLGTRVDHEDAFRTVMLEQGAGLARIAFFLCGDRTRAEDLVAEALARAWPKWSAGRIDSLVPYLRRAVVNLAAKEHRHRLVVFRHDERAAPPSPSPGADENLWARVDLGPPDGLSPTGPTGRRGVALPRGHDRSGHGHAPRGVARDREVPAGPRSRCHANAARRRRRCLNETTWPSGYDEEFLRQAPDFDVRSSLPGKVSALVRRRHRLRVTLAVVGAAAVVAAVAVPLSSLRSAPLGHRITPATTPTTSSTPSTTVTAAGALCRRVQLPRPLVHDVGDGGLDHGHVGPRHRHSHRHRRGLTRERPLALRCPLSVVVQGGGHFSEAVVPPAQTNAVILWPIAPLPPPGTSPASSTANSNGLCLVEFPGQSLPTVVLGLDTGGAHCCTVVRAVTLSSTGLGPVVDDNLGNPGARLRADGGHALIVTADNAFAYTFASYAASGMPIKVLQFSHGAFVDVTRQHPDLVSQDAVTWMTTFDGAQGNGLGALAAWVADECLLGQSVTAWSTVDQLQAQGMLTGPAGWPTGAAYVAALRTFVTQHRYCPS